MNVPELLLMTRARRYAASGEGKRLREAAHLSLREVASAVGVAPHTLWKWETGDRTPHAAGATAWAAFLNELARESA